MFSVFWPSEMLLKRNPNFFFWLSNCKLLDRPKELKSLLLCNCDNWFGVGRMHYALGVRQSDYPQGSSRASCAQLSYSSCWDPGQLSGCPPCLLLPYPLTHSAYARPLRPSPELWCLAKQLQFDFPSFFRVTSPRIKGGKKKSLLKPCLCHCFPPASEACGTIWLQDRPWALLSR